MDGEKEVSRRGFLRSSAAAAAAFAIPSGMFSQGGSQIRVGVIGSGGRGSGAAIDAAAAHPDVVIWAMGDLFADRVDGSRRSLQESLKDRCQVTDDRVFTGFDNYKGVLSTDVDAVILTAPPGFRPQHLRAAVDAGKHVFCEKPVAVDAPGVRSVFESSDLAAKKGLNIVAGTQRRYDVAYMEAIKRIHDYEIGEIMACYCYWNQGGLWMNRRKPEWSDMEWQVRNWLYFTWLSGDHIVEQHVHNLDVCNWAMGQHPIRALGLGGRQVRTDPAYGHVYDHFAVEYEYEKGVKMLSMSRQIDGTASRVSEHLVGTLGTSNANTWIRGVNNWRFDGERPNPYVEEHRALYSAMLDGKTINEGRQVAESTLTAIMGRMSCYSGQEVTWDTALNSQESLVPEPLALGDCEVAPVAMPGKTRVF